MKKSLYVFFLLISLAFVTPVQAETFETAQVETTAKPKKDCRKKHHAVKKSNKKKAKAHIAKYGKRPKRKF